MIPVMFHLTRGKKVQVEFVEIDKDNVTEEERGSGVPQARLGSERSPYSEED
jgi:hypothetical protein